MLWEFIKPRLPLIIISIGITIAIALVKKMSDIRKIITLAMAVNNILSIMKGYAPKIYDSLLQGIGFSIGGIQVGGASDDDACARACDNKFTTENIQKKVQEQVQEVAIANGIIADPAIEQRKNTGQEPEMKIISSGKNVNVLHPKHQLILCQALKSSGFNPKWSINDVKMMKMSVEGRRKLRSIAKDVEQKTGLRNLTNNEISNCFGTYLPNYLCVKKGSIVNSSTKKKKAQTTDFGPSLDHCNWEAINQDITKSVGGYYEGKGQENDEKFVITVNYTIERAKLEFRNLINLYQHRTKEFWNEFLLDRKEINPLGYPIDGTQYLLPWDLFRKYDICFGYYGNNDESSSE